MTRPGDDPERRIADLEKQDADARRIADLERQLAQAKGEQEYADLDVGRTPSAPRDDRLADAPRRIPFTFLLAEVLPFRWWFVFAMFMVAVAPIALWMEVPATVAPAAILTLVLLYAFQFTGARKRLALVKWGRVAIVTRTQLTSRATYYSGTTWSNVIMPQAHGWTVTRQFWSGRNTKTTVDYTLDGYQGSLVVSGREYIDGVILADQRRPERALCVSSFLYDLDRDAGGNWTGRLRTRQIVGMVFWVLIVLVWLALGTGVGLGVATDLFATRLSPGENGTVNNGGTVYCNDGNLSVDGTKYTTTVHGHCASLHVSGIDGVITVDSADTITLSGIDNAVTYHSGEPTIVHGGIDTTASRG
jgi:hypothetical protein